MLLLCLAYAFNVHSECMDKVFVYRLSAEGISRDAAAVLCVRIKHPQIS